MQLGCIFPSVLNILIYTGFFVSALFILQYCQTFYLFLFFFSIWSLLLTLTITKHQTDAKCEARPSYIQTLAFDPECASSLKWAKEDCIKPLLISLHWLVVAARIRFEVLTLAFRTTAGTAPTYLNTLLQVYDLSCQSWSCIVTPSQRRTKSPSKTLTLSASLWWKELPTSMRSTENITDFKQQLKGIPLLPALQKTKKHLHYSSFPKLTH